jgi:predicted  nucleic acid-binding Zn-ribbon protein
MDAYQRLREELTKRKEKLESTHEWDNEQYGIAYYAVSKAIQLLDENQAQAKEIEQLKGALEDLFLNREKWRESHMQLEVELQSLREREARYRDGLKFYADDVNWVGMVDGSSNMHVDGGTFARSILEENK